MGNWAEMSRADHESFHAQSGQHRAQPLFFGPPERPLFGWYHPGVEGSSAGGEGLVLCSPLGQEDLNAHRSLRHLAMSAAQAGTPVLRFDYDGCGNSAGDDCDPDRPSMWLASIDAAIGELKRQSGVDRVCLLGVRAGALLAAQAAARREDVSSLIAIAPVTSGRALVREWTTLAVVNQWKGSDNGEERGGPRKAAGNGSEFLEAAGYVVTRATCDQLSRVDLMSLQRVAPEVLVIDRDDLPRRDRWATHLASIGACVTHEVLPGYMGMMSEPHAVRIPTAMVERVLSWLSRAGGPGLAAPAARPAVVPQAHAALVDPLVRETPLRFDDHGWQFGVLSEPAMALDDVARPGLLLINSGACRHIGPNRLYTPLARLFASRGWYVLRVDVSGIGDSEPHDGEPANAPYTSKAAQDIDRWCAVLRQRGAGKCYLLGICSGAYHGFRAAVAGSRFAAVVAINPVVFFWHDGMPLDPPLANHSVMRLSLIYKKSVLDASKWRRVFSGKADIMQAVKVMSHRVFARAASFARSAARTFGFTLQDDLFNELRRIESNGRRLHFIFSDGDPGLPLLHEQGGRMVGRLVRRGQLSTHILAGADHTFSTHAARRALMSELEARLSMSAESAGTHVPVGLGRTLAQR